MCRTKLLEVVRHKFTQSRIHTWIPIYGSAANANLPRKRLFSPLPTPAASLGASSPRLFRNRRMESQMAWEMGNGKWKWEMALKSRLGITGFHAMRNAMVTLPHPRVFWLRTQSAFHIPCASLVCSDDALFHGGWIIVGGITILAICLDLVCHELPLTTTGASICHAQPKSMCILPIKYRCYEPETFSVG